MYDHFLIPLLKLGKSFGGEKGEIDMELTTKILFSWKKSSSIFTWMKGTCIYWQETLSIKMFLEKSDFYKFWNQVKNKFENLKFLKLPQNFSVCVLGLKSLKMGLWVVKNVENEKKWHFWRKIFFKNFQKFWDFWGLGVLSIVKKGQKRSFF